MRLSHSCLVAAGLSILLISTPVYSQPVNDDPWPSWSDGATKKAILDFVRITTDMGSPQFVPVEQRIATFDIKNGHDGLWDESEQLAG